MKKTETILKNKRLRPTAMRLLILEFLQRHAAATDLSELEREFDHADRVTIYRTLKTFEEKGIIHKIVDNSGLTKYGLCSPGCDEHEHHDTHVHFHCKNCDRTFCLTSTSLKMPELPPLFTCDDISLLVKGICANCRRQSLQ